MNNNTNNNKTTVFYNTKDISNILQCSMNTARKVMMSPDFPLIKVGKNFKVNKAAFDEWAIRRHI